MATTDTDVQQLVINKLTKQQYDAIATKSPTELYAVTDEPSANDGVLTIQQNGVVLGTFSANQSTNETINITGGGGTSYTAGTGISIDANNEISIDDTVVAELSDLPTNFTGATSSAAGAHGLVPAPAAGDDTKYLKGDGTWATIVPSLVEMSYGESNAWAKFIAAYNAGSIVYCRASSNSNPATGTQGRKAFMAYVNNATTPTEVEFQYVRSVSSKTDSQQGDQVFIYKLTNASGGTWTVTTRNMSAKIVAGTGMTSSFTTGANATITLSAEPNYSTSEVDTKVKWVDNKTIYRKTINFGSLPNNSTKNVAHGVSGLSQLVKIDAIMNRPGTNGGFYPLPFVSKAAANDQIEISVNSTNVSIATNIDWSSCTAYVTIYYTKS